MRVSLQPLAFLLPAPLEAPVEFLGIHPDGHAPPDLFTFDLAIDAPPSEEDIQALLSQIARRCGGGLEEGALGLMKVSIESPEKDMWVDVPSLDALDALLVRAALTQAEAQLACSETHLQKRLS